MVIKYLKDDMLGESAKKLADTIEENEIQWVLTVPAIWTIPAKKFMRECAIEAGIPSSNLLIALEPEAASLYCKYLTIQREKDGNNDFDVLSSFQPGARYMVVDAGGGTVDIVIHEVCADGTLKEIYQANGGNWGGTTVDKAFHDFLTNIVGIDVMKRFQDDHKDDFLDLQREFEVKKRSVKPDLKSKVKFKISVSLSEIYKDVNSESVSKRIERDKELNGKVNFMADKILFDCSIFKNLFSSATDNLVRHLKNILEEEATEDVNTILMVGGFSESPMLFESVKSSFKDRKVLLPEGAGLSVLRGAVIFGHDRKDISIRISQYTYGYNYYGKYDPKKHPQGIVIVKSDGKKRVRGCFKKWIEIGDKLLFNEISTKHELFPHDDHTDFSLKLYASQQPNPMYVHDPGCFKLGKVNVDCKDDKGNVGCAIVQLLFGGTEFEVKAILEATGKETKATFSFLD